MPLVYLVATTAACIDRPVTSVEPVPTIEEQTEFPVHVIRDVDLLFVIDNSGSMQPEQESLAVNFYRLISVLESLPEGLPNLHIGVVSTDMGAGDVCGAGGGGRLQHAPRVNGCSPPDGAFISDVEGVRNYSGTLADTFSCIARLGNDGCGFEQPLAAMRAALDGSNPENDGFLRDDALLAVVFITDEDDCSAFDQAMFDRTDDPSSALGALSSFRCFEFGVECDGDDPRSLGAKENCHPRSDSPYISDVAGMIDFVHGLKSFDKQIVVAAIAGNPTPVAVAADADGNPCLDYSCGSAPVCGDPGDLPAAVPAVRLQAFLDSFEQHTLTTICGDDLSGAMDDVARIIGDSLRRGCVLGALTDGDPATAGVQPTCVVTEIRDPLGAHDQTVLPECDRPDDPPSSSTLPCWHLAEDAAACPTSPQHLEFEIVYPDQESVPPDTRIDARCVAD